MKKIVLKGTQEWAEQPFDKQALGVTRGFRQPSQQCQEWSWDYINKDLASFN